MSYKFKLPDIGEGVHEGEIIKWFVKPGDAVVERQVIVEVMTDKASVEITSPVSGIVSVIHNAEGSTVNTGSVFIEFEEQHETDASKITTSLPVKTAEVEKPVPVKKAVDIFSPPEDLGGMYSLDDEEPLSENVPQSVRSLPRTRKLAREMGVDIFKLKGTGRDGRITDEDVQKASGKLSAKLMSEGVSDAAQASAAPAEMISNRHYEQGRPSVSSEGERKPLTGLRKRIAENMEISHHYVPKAVHFDEFDLTDLVALRSRLKDEALKKGVKLTYLPFFIKAAAIALKEFADVNSCFDEADRSIVEMAHVNIGVAVDTDKGLIVPVIKDADLKTILQLAKEISELAALAREGKISKDDLKDASFTVTNIGSIGGMMSVPVVYHPQAAIMATHSITPRPVVVDDEIVIRDMMYISIAFDHRITDGARIARFGNRVKEMLETPYMLAFL
jgi:pyruvate dehydrogenase E2 component (dihydrolipoamide acetyltransferase)